MRTAGSMQRPKRNSQPTDTTFHQVDQNQSVTNSKFDNLLRNLLETTVIYKLSDINAIIYLSLIFMGGVTFFCKIVNCEFLNCELCFGEFMAESVPSGWNRVN